MPKKAAEEADETGTEPNADVAKLGYEDARDELASIVSRLEGGTETLEESMRLWERGEALAAHCERWLDGAQRKIDAMTEDETDRG
jgi:exodeoxyribonuclease VII small subunit